MGDEQDLLSMYLINGFCIDTESIQGKTILLQNSDALVRVRKKPSSNRTVFHIPGLFLPPPWNLVCREIYLSNDRLKFAMLEVILNQSPNNLYSLAKKLRDWKGGRSRNDDLVFSKYQIRQRVFSVAIHLFIETNLSEEFLEYTRGVGKAVAGLSGGTDCLILYRMQKSKTLTYDAISFFRFRPGPKESENI